MKETRFKIFFTSFIFLFLTSCSSNPISSSSSSDRSSNLNPLLNNNLVIYSTAADLENELILEFWAKENNVNLEIVSLTSGEIDSELKVANGTPNADIRFGDMNYSRFMENQSFYKDYISKNDYLMPLISKNKNGFVTNYKLIGNAFLTNTRLESKDNIIISSYADLVDQRIDSIVSIGSAVISEKAYYTITNLLLAFGDGSYLDERAWTYLEQVIKNNKGVIIGSFFDVHILVMSDEAIVGLTDEENALTMLYDGVGKVSLVYPSEGVVFNTIGASLLSGSKNEETAKSFLDWLNSDAAQRQVSLLKHRPANTKIHSKDKYLPSLENINILVNDEELVYNLRPEISSRFQALVNKYYLGGVYE